MKVVLNKRRGPGFDLSPYAIKYFFKLKNKPIFFYKQLHFKNRDGFDEWVKVASTEINNRERNYFICTKDCGMMIHSLPHIYEFDVNNISRSDTDLICTIENLGYAANTDNTYLVISDAPDSINKWKIVTNDGVEEILLIPYF